MLKSLVGEVDAELFEAVVLVVFEAEDVEDADGEDLRKKDLSLSTCFSLPVKYSSRFYSCIVNILCGKRG